MTLTYSDGAELESGDAALLRELEQKVEAAKAKFKRYAITQDYHDMLDAHQALRIHCLTVLAEGCEVCDDGEVVIGWRPASTFTPREAVYAPCVECRKRYESYLASGSG